MSESSDDMKGGPSNRPYHRGNVAADLRAAAERILASENLEDVSVRRLAREVGIAPANFYNHFRNLDELLAKIASSSLEQAITRAVTTWSGPGSKPELLVASATEFIRFCLKNKQLMRLMLRRREREDGDERDDVSARSLAEVVRFIHGDAAGAAPEELEAEKHGLAVGYIALTYGFALILSEGRFAVDENDDAALARFVRNGILPFLDGSAAATLAKGERTGGPSG